MPTPVSLSGLNNAMNSNVSYFTTSNLSVVTNAMIGGSVIASSNLIVAGTLTAQSNLIVKGGLSVAGSPSV